MKLIKRKKIKQIENQVEYFDITTLVSNWETEIMPAINNSHYKVQKNAKELGYPYQSTLDDFVKYTNANNKTKEYIAKYLNQKKQNTIQTQLDINIASKKQKTIEMFME